MDERAEPRTWWPWAVGVLVLALLVWAVAGLMTRAESGVQVEETVPAAR